MSSKNANEAAGRIIPGENPMIVGDVPDGETEPRALVEVNEGVSTTPKPKTDHNLETEPGQTEPVDKLHPGEN